MFSFLKSLLLLVTINFSTLADTFTAHCRDRPPVIITNKTSSCSGALPDILKIALGRIGHNIEWKTVPWPRSKIEAKKGKVDILLGHSLTTDRRKFLLPILYGQKVRKLSFYMSPKASAIKVKSEKDLKKYTIGVLRGSFYGPRFNRMSHQNIQQLENIKQMISMLIHGRIDLVAVRSTYGNIIKNKLEQIGAKPVAYFEEFLNGRYISIPKKSTKMKHYKALSREILKMRKSGEISWIFKYYKISSPKQIIEYKDN